MTVPPSTTPPTAPAAQPAAAHNVTARLSALLSVFLIVAAAVILYVTSHPGAGTTQVEAEFQDAFPILAGMDVRESGAVAGSVRDVELTDRGTAMVTLTLNEGTEPPQRDASAAIRQQDITGDSYIALDPGQESEDLGDTPIPTSRTIVAPRFDDLLNSLGDKERAAVRLLLVESGKALDRQGPGLNEAILRLRPGLEAANRATSQLATQNQALRSLVTNAEAVTSQAAPRSHQLASLIDSLSATLGETADHGEALDRALEVAPKTASETTQVLAQLRRTAVAAAPLARTLEDRAPELAQSVRRLGPFLAGTRGTLTRLTPTVASTASALEQGAPTIKAAPEHVVTAPFDLAGDTDGLLKALLGNESVLKTLAGADGYGKAPENADDTGLGSIGVERGNQLGYTGNDPDRNFLRAMVVPSCEIFAVKIAPLCLDAAVAAGKTGSAREGASATPQLAPSLSGVAAPAGTAVDAAGSPAQAAGAAGGEATSAAPGDAPSKQGALDLLDFLLGGGKGR
jgi:phospholipid/cholesterol/gamma-HCH transport system substrate-binding protein